MPAIDCGIDIGSTNVKVVFAGDDGRVLLTRSVPSPRTHDGIGPVTDAMALVSTLENLIIGGWRDLATNAPLRSIAAAGIGEDGLGVTASIKPAGPAIPWFDKRAAAEAVLLQQYQHLSAKAGIAMDATRTAAKWLWLHRHRSREIDEAAWWVALTDFPAAWWTGKPFMSSSLAPRTGCFNVYDRVWIGELLSAAHAPALPKILNAGEIVGGVREGRLREMGAASAETLVVAGGHDHPMAAALIRRFDPLARVDSMGTANLIYGETGVITKPRLDNDLAFSVPPSGSKGFACLGVLELSSALKSIGDDANGLRAFMSQDRLPGSPPQAQGDLHVETVSRSEKIRRALETVTLQARHMLDAMNDAGVPDGGIYATGGWSRAKSFIELRASVFGQAIHVVGDMELTAMGAALFGAEAAIGKSACPIHREDIATVEPVDEWVPVYDRVYRSS
jgi:xylulokinase